MVREPEASQTSAMAKQGNSAQKRNRWETKVIKISDNENQELAAKRAYGTICRPLTYTHSISTWCGPGSFRACPALFSRIGASGDMCRALPGDVENRIMWFGKPVVPGLSER